MNKKVLVIGIVLIIVIAGVLVWNDQRKGQCEVSLKPAEEMQMQAESKEDSNLCDCEKPMKKWVKEGLYGDDQFNFKAKMPERWFVEEIFPDQENTWERYLSFSNYLSTGSRFDNPDDFLSFQVIVYSKKDLKEYEKFKNEMATMEKISDVKKEYDVADGDVIKYFEITKSSNLPEEPLGTIFPDAKGFLEHGDYFYKFSIQSPALQSIQEQETRALRSFVESFEFLKK